MIANISDKIVIIDRVNTEKNGTYFVEYNVADEAGNKADMIQREVFVGSKKTQMRDENPPVITLNGEEKLTLHLGDIYTELGASAVDDRDGIVDVVMSGIVDSTIPMHYILSYSAQDKAGNKAKVEREVEVLDGAPIRHNGVQYFQVESLLTGRTWLDRNVGATKVCDAIDDSACFGDFYQWGRNSDGHQKSNSAQSDVPVQDLFNAGASFITSDSQGGADWVAQGMDDDGSLRSMNWSKTDGSSVCPPGFRVPLVDELRNELLGEGSAMVKNSADALETVLKLPAAGLRGTGGNVSLGGEILSMWTASTLLEGEATTAQYLDITSDFIGFGSSAYRANGLSIRCIED